MSCQTFKELLDACTAYYKKNAEKVSPRIQQNRSELANCAEVFHEQCGTLTPLVREKVEDLRHGFGIVLMTAHQPNLLAYSGVLRKATLSFVLARKLRQLLHVPVVSFFGIADQDFSDDRWVRSCQLPAVQRRDGVMHVDVKLPEKLVLKKVAKPSRDLLWRWKNEIIGWLEDAAGSVIRLLSVAGFSAAPFMATLSKIRENFGSFWNIVEDCYKRSENYSDFNAFVISKIVNEVWGYDTVFLRFSESQRIFCDDFNFLLSHSNEYSSLMRKAIRLSDENGNGAGVSVQEPQLAPFWYDCTCGSKAKLFLRNRDGSLIGEGCCVRCGQSYLQRFGVQSEPDMSHISLNVSARAISMNLIFFRGLSPSCYVGGVGGARYLAEARYIARRLRLPFPPTAIWRPRDKYLGLAQMEALLESRRVCSDLGVHDLSEARSLLEARILEIHAVLDTFELEKNKLVDHIRENPGNFELKEKIKQVSIERTRAERSSDLSVIARELKILRNVPLTINLMPSMLDYAINVGLKETSDQWVQFLENDGSLTSDVHLESVLDRLAGIDQRVRDNTCSVLYGGE